MVFGRTGSGAHAINVARASGPGKMTLVMAAAPTSVVASDPDFCVSYNAQQ
jgi:hypothetical protein